MPVFSPLNYSLSNHRYVFYITATQSYPYRPLTSSTAIAQINLVNCNVNTPLFIPLNQTFSISKTAPIGTQFGTILAVDLNNDAIIFTINPPSAQFSINQFTGVLKLDQALQTSTSVQFLLTIVATDDASSCSPDCLNCTQLQSTTTITILIQTANTQAPRFLNQLCGSNLSFSENSPSGTNIATIVAVDNDLGSSGQIVFSFPPIQTQTTGNLSHVKRIILFRFLNLIFKVSSSGTTTYSNFQLVQYNQTNNIRIAQLQTNGTFSYSTPGKGFQDFKLFIISFSIIISRRYSRMVFIDTGHGSGHTVTSM